jgi:Ca2+-binding EF-hand superfamily protein
MMLRVFNLIALASPVVGWWANPLKAWGNPLANSGAAPATMSKPVVTPPGFVAPFDKAEWVFKYFDDDANGYLDESELKAAFVALGTPADDATLKHSFSLIDTNHDGKISLDEFRVMAEQNVLPSMSDVFMRDNDHAFVANEGVFDGFVSVRDRKLADENPKKYCADRCLATGFCDALEDFYDMTTSQVQTFCEQCAGSDECELAYA